MAIREYAQKVGFKIIGKLTRHPEREWNINYMTGEKYYIGAKIYSDEAGNEYYISKKGVCIVTADDGVI